MSLYLIELNEIDKEYNIGEKKLHVLKRVTLSIKSGEFVCITGPSGSGKSTLLHIIGCLEKPTAGGYLLDGINVLNAGDDELSRLRSNSLGFVFQTFNLISFLTLLENVELPFLYSNSNIDKKHARQKALSAIKRVGLSDRVTHRPLQLSGGEMQRTAIARAIAINPKLILADEPTGNLDSKTSIEMMGLFEEIHQQGNTVIVVTHEEDIARHAHRIIRLIDGEVESDEVNKNIMTMADYDVVVEN